MKILVNVKSDEISYLIQQQKSVITYKNANNNIEPIMKYYLHLDILHNMILLLNKDRLIKIIIHKFTIYLKKQKLKAFLK